MTAQLHVSKLTQFARMLTLLTRKKKRTSSKDEVRYTRFHSTFTRVANCASRSLCMITTAAVQGYPFSRSPVRSEMHFTENSCRNCFQPVTVPLCCAPSQLLFSSLRFSTPHYMQRELDLSRDFKEKLRIHAKLFDFIMPIPPVPLPPHGTLPSLPSCRRTEADSFSPYGSP